METIVITGTDLSLTTDELTISYHDKGNGDIPIIFIHGFPFDKSMWIPQIDNLSKTHRVIAYDLRGFGKSTAMIEAKTSIDMHVLDLIRFMDALAIKKAILCGLSMGGYVLLNAVSKYPERFKAIILCGTQCKADSQDAKENRYSAIKQITLNGLTDFATATIKNVFWPGTLVVKKELLEKLRNQIRTASPLAITGTLHALAERDEICSALIKFNLPTLILCGQNDTVIPIEQSEFLQQRISGSKLQRINDAGHLSNIDQVEKFNQYVDLFITNLKD
jgi:pimeloyl-ACP methyl ester carboxylesterase